MRVLAVARSVEVQVAHGAGGVFLGRDLPPCLTRVLLGACREAARDSLQPAGIDVAVFVLLGVLWVWFCRFRARIASEGLASIRAINSLPVLHLTGATGDSVASEWHLSFSASPTFAGRLPKSSMRMVCIARLSSML